MLQSAMEASNRDLKSDRSASLSTAIEHGSQTNTPSTSRHPSKSNLRRAHTVAQGANTKKKLDIRAARDRAATSIPKLEDSHELLRQRSLGRSDTLRTPRDTFAGARDTNHFTVGNVGQNGKIFLRPIRNPSQKEHRPSPSLTTTTNQREHLQPQNPGNGSARWSNSQLSELRPESIFKDDREDAESVVTDSMPSEYPRSHRPRAHSFSTISEHQSVSGSRRGEFRIVIDRSEDGPKSADGKRRPPTIEVPIPHYRLGTPQFNNEGSAPLHSSVYTRTSFSDNFRVSRLLRENSPLPYVYPDDPSQAGRPSFAASMYSAPIAIDLGAGPTGPEKPVVYELKEPIEPSVFEALLPDMDNESVVRYIPGTKDLSQATPARIVAQISSESFMDYELVSDFFLTFRSYLSSSNLLALLLARLEWAINRLQDDGRIIRIRTFAALRHWILNYFVDDFVVNYDLRVQFCNTINAMYDDVKGRESGGMSDLKILMDLKRCWHGKCCLYWESPDLTASYQSPDNPIVPGGVVADGDMDAHRFIGRYQNTGHVESVSAGDEANQTGTGEPQALPLILHDRNGSAATAKSVPISPRSEQSVHVTSCSLPPKSPKRVSVPFPKGKAPHPVPIIPAKFAPSEPSSMSPGLPKRHPFHTHAHKRSGSFSDSVRDERAPLSLLKLEQASFSSSQEILNSGSLIRGDLYPPAESYMTMMAPPSPPLPSSTSNTTLDCRNTSEAGKSTSSHSGVKTIIGSIRRALNGKSGRQGSSERSGNTPLHLRGKTSAVPNNVAFGSDLYRDRKTATPKKPARIDVLCDAVLKDYHNVVARQEQKDQSQTATAPAQTAQEPGLGIENAQQADQKRAQSQLTMGSESIVIVDDTGFDFPSTWAATPELPAPRLEQAPDIVNAEDSLPTPKPFSFGFSSQRSRADDEYSLPIYYDDTGPGLPSRMSRFLRPSGLSLPRRSNSMERGSTSHKRISQSLRLRKYASFQSVISKNRLTMGSEVPATPDLDLSKSAGPILRRRPGGDLRRMQNGLGLRSYAGSGSFRTIASYKSMADSMDSVLKDQASRPQTSLIPIHPNPRFSLIPTNSHQNMRRSFEAAIARFAQIPDDDDGGIESTLLKLEGKWDSPTGNPRPETYQGAPSSRTGRLLVPPRPYSDSVAESEESYNSIPLLERGLCDESMRKPALSRINSVPAAPRSQLNDIASQDTSNLSSHQSFDMVKETESLRRIPRGSTLPTSTPRASRGITSRRSGLSSELSAIDYPQAHRQSIGSSLGDSAVEIPPHPLAQPPSPPMTIQNPRSMSSFTTPLNTVLFQSKPLTPDPSPRRNTGRDAIRSIDIQQVSGDVLSKSEADRQPQNAKGPENDHIPFVLSCESHVLAQQLTLVEMAALSEVDWRDLVEMRWSSGAPSRLNWAQFLTEEDHRGIDLVVGRFNLMVKWVLSEIVLTQDIHERARTITKFIHTAAHAKRLCNYATMLEIAIALSSTDCSRLTKTWALVTVEDRRVLKDMEALIQPVRNFHDLRVEMETANLQEGCIPFVGLYVHDLTYNAQKPAQISNPQGEPLVNFERYRTAARIVKNLLRLIDASTKYNFQPVQGIIERCLWIAALSEEQIQTRSKSMD